MIIDHKSRYLLCTSKKRDFVKVVFNDLSEVYGLGIISNVCRCKHYELLQKTEGDDWGKMSSGGTSVLLSNSVY